MKQKQSHTESTKVGRGWGKDVKNFLTIDLKSFLKLAEIDCLLYTNRPKSPSPHTHTHTHIWTGQTEKLEKMVPRPWSGSKHIKRKWKFNYFVTIVQLFVVVVFSAHLCVCVYVCFVLSFRVAGRGQKKFNIKLTCNSLRGSAYATLALFGQIQF